MPVFDVKAIAVNPDTGEIVAGPRVETVDTDTNEIFEDCSTPWEVENRYDAYWNRLNASWEYNFPQGKDKVLVLSVKPAS
jgi:hypothetical protein